VVFNSLTFVAFFAIVLALHSLRLPWTFRKVNLLLASYVFYAAWNPPFILLLWASTFIDWKVAHWIDRTEDRARRKLVMLLSVVFNLGMLGYFKYGGFLLESFQSLAATVGIAATGTLYGVLASGLRVRETLVPMLLLPVVSPVLLGATRAWEAAIDGVPGDAWPWVGLLSIFAVLYVAVGMLAFGPLLEEA